jgi:outer membrane receptor protein involved in Fe transport
MRYFGRFFFLAFLFLPLSALPQSLQGQVSDEQEPLPGAQIFWLGTDVGVLSDADGRFTIPLSDKSQRLVIAFAGYRSDTLLINDANFLQINLKALASLAEVTVRSRSTFIDQESIPQMEVITAKELTKAACCNLSESFETNASIDVSYNDAVTGAKQIRMLGLEGTYVLTSVENIPYLRGLATTYGLQYIPGTWIQSIDLGKGAGSVVNGYESMTGQINVELQKPDSQEPILLNLFANQMGRLESNLNVAHKVSDKWSTAVLLHASTLRNRVDDNEDGFLDTPLYTQYNLINRWKRSSERWMMQLGIKALYEDRQAGQMPEMIDHSQGHGPFLANMKTQRMEFFAKNALLFPKTPYRGLGWIVNATHHRQEGIFGQNVYEGQQQTLYSNIIYQDIFGNTNHSYKAGMSYLLDSYDEQYRDSTFRRTESVSGIFAEYTYQHLEKFSAVVGARVDFHNMYGNIFTPRLHLKYQPREGTVLRASAGSGFRVPNPLAENTAGLVSARRIRVEEDIRPERAWNYGFNIGQDFMFFGRKASMHLDFYRTDFQNQLIADFDASPQELRFYNLRGQSYANSFQAEWLYEPLKQLDLKAAYKWQDVQMTIDGALRQKPLVSRHKVLLNASYSTPFDIWQFDFTAQWTGTQRVPDTSGNPEAFRRPDQAPAFWTLNAQITRAFRKWDWYVGVENLNNYRQEQPIIDPQNPFGQFFDASLIWAPIIGRMVYTGIRVKL